MLTNQIWNWTRILPLFFISSIVTSSSITWVTISEFKAIWFFSRPRRSSNPIYVWIIFPEVRFHLSIIISWFSFRYRVIRRIFIGVMIRFRRIGITVFWWRFRVIAEVWPVCIRRFLRSRSSSWPWSRRTRSTITEKILNYKYLKVIIIAIKFEKSTFRFPSLIH